MAFAGDAKQWVKLHSLTSEKGKCLNDKTGRLVSFHKNLAGQFGNDRYKVEVQGKCHFIKVDNIWQVNEQWLKDVAASPMRKNREIMMTDFSAPGVYPCPMKDLRQPKLPGATNKDHLKTMLSWWGKDVYSFIRQKMEEQRYHKGSMNWQLDAAINAGTLQVAAVWSDGANHASADVGGMWWPTISFPLYNSRMRGSYCQGLALQNGASPWQVYEVRLEIYGEYGVFQVDSPLMEVEIRNSPLQPGASPWQENNEKDDQDSEDFIMVEIPSSCVIEEVEE